MGAPPNPVDGTKYAELLLGVPMVLEYDDSTGGFKLVIDVENSLEVTMTGITLDVGTLSSITNWQIPAQYAEDSVFVGGMTGTMMLAVRTDRMQTWVSDDGDLATLNVDILGRLYTYTTGSHTFADTEMSAAVALGDALANPTAGGVGAYNLGYDPVAATWRRLRVDPETFGLLVSITGSVDTELPAAVALADAMANPTVPFVGSHLMIWDEGDSEWDRARSTIAPELDGIAEGTVSPALAASTFGMGFDPVAGDWNRIRLDAVTGAQIVGVTGTVSVALESGDIELGAVELKDADTDDRQRVTADGRAWVNAYITGTVLVDTELPSAVVLSDGMGNPTPPAVGAFGMGWDGLDWNRIRVGSIGEQVVSVTGTVTVDTELPAAAALSDAFGNPTAPAVGAFTMGIERAGGDWARIDAQPLGTPSQIRRPSIIDAEYGLVTVGGVYGADPSTPDDEQLQLVDTDSQRRLQVRAYVTGTVNTELPAAAVAADGFANPTAPSVLSHLMGYNGVTWDRIYMGLSGSLAVDLITQLDAVNDEVTAYVTGTLSVDTELPSAVVLSDGMATPTPPAVGAFGMGYDPVADDWNRIRLDAVTGAQLVGITGTVSTAIAADLPLVVTEDEVTAYITGSTSLNLMGKTIVRAVIDVSGSAAGEETLVAAVGGEKIKVLEAMLIGNADVSIFFQSGFTGTALTGPLSLPSDGDGFFIETPAQIEAHHFETLAGEALVLDIDANVLLGGWINYYTEA